MIWLAIGIFGCIAMLALVIAGELRYQLYQAMRRERRPLPGTVDLRRSAAARKGWETRRKSAAEPDVFDDELQRVLRQIDAQAEAKAK